MHQRLIIRQIIIENRSYVPRSCHGQGTALESGRVWLANIRPHSSLARHMSNCMRPLDQGGHQIILKHNEHPSPKYALTTSKSRILSLIPTTIYRTATDVAHPGRRGPLGKRWVSPFEAHSTDLHAKAKITNLNTPHWQSHAIHHVGREPWPEAGLPVPVHERPATQEIPPNPPEG